MPGALTSQAEVTHVATYGLWLLVGDEELFLSFANFPWFKDATIAELSNVEHPTDNHFTGRCLTLISRLSRFATRPRFRWCQLCALENASEGKGALGV